LRASTRLVEAHPPRPDHRLASTLRHGDGPDRQLDALPPGLVAEPSASLLAVTPDLTVGVELGEAPEVIGEAVTVSQGVERGIDVRAEIDRRLVVGARRSQPESGSGIPFHHFRRDPRDRGDGSFDAHVASSSLTPE